MNMVLTTLLSDHKCTVTLYDMTTQDDGDGIVMNIFRPPKEMPFIEAGDMVIVNCAKTQSFNSSTPSLLTNFRTDIHVYDGERLSKCKSARAVLLARRDPTRKVSREPDAKENEYVLWLYHRLDKTLIPDREELTARAGQSLNLRDKFSALKDVKEGKFADLVVEVVRPPFELGDKICMWVSDYTEHSDFFNRPDDDGQGWADGRPTRDGDPFGYTGKFNKKHNFSQDDEQQWFGPSGKMSMQVTCWEPHADFIRNYVKAGDWVRLRNVQIGFGRSVANIEGFLRTDLKYSERLYVDVLDTEANSEMINPHLKDALRRKRDYEREHRKKDKAQGKKRSAPDEPLEENAKTRRKKSRTERQKERQEKESKAEEELGLNELIICENHDQSMVSLSTILEPVPYHTTINNEAITLYLPFTNAKYRTQVRVVDFHPANLQDFAVSVKRNKYACLSDNGHESDDDEVLSTSSSCVVDYERKGYVWEWQFALKVEEVSASTSNRTKKKPAAATWVLVDNHDAQLLIGFDATNLHAEENYQSLQNLREQMFTLWGNLEERKSKEEAARRKRAKKPLEAPPVDSDPEEDTVTIHMGGGGDDGVPPSSQLTNKPFRCCLRQYGIKMEAGLDEEANAGEGYRWERMFGMFGTKIRSDDVSIA